MRKKTCNGPKLDLVNMNAYIKFGENLSICSDGQTNGMTDSPNPI